MYGLHQRSCTIRTGSRRRLQGNAICCEREQRVIVVRQSATMLQLRYQSIFRPLVPMDTIPAQPICSGRLGCLAGISWGKRDLYCRSLEKNFQSFGETMTVQASLMLSCIHMISKQELRTVYPNAPLKAAVCYEPL